MILVAIPAFSTADSIHFVSANSPTMQIRFGSKSYCGYNITQTEGIQKHEALGCVSAGFSYTIDHKAMSMYLPSAITVSLSKAAAMLIVCKVSLSLYIYTLAAYDNENSIDSLRIPYSQYTLAGVDDRVFERGPKQGSPIHSCTVAFYNGRGTNILHLAMLYHTRRRVRIRQ